MEFLDSLYSLFSAPDIGLDLGTCNTVVCVRGKGIVLSEPSVVAVKKGTNKVLMNGQAVGVVAKEMLGKTSEEISVIRPLKDGVIADFDVTEALIRYFIQKVYKGGRWLKPLVIVAVPWGVTNVEKRAVISSAERAGARKVYLVSEPRAAGLGLGLPIDKPQGGLICDIGGGTTEVAVLSLGEIVACKSIRVAGDEMDMAVISYMKNVHSFGIGLQTAEKIKINIGSVYPLENEISMDVRGIDLKSFVPKKITISSGEIRDALKEPLKSIIQVIREVLEETPPELSSDLADAGLVLAGGGSLIKGIDKAISEEINIAVRVSKEPMLAVSKGLSIILDNLPNLKNSLESLDNL